MDAAVADHDMLLMRDETFGPVMAIMAWKNASQAIALANDSSFGLAASVWTYDKERGRTLAGTFAVARLW